MSLEKLDLMLKEGSPGDLDSVLGIFSVIGLSRVASPPVRITTGSMFGVSSSEFGVRGSGVGGRGLLLGSRSRILQKQNRLAEARLLKRSSLPRNELVAAAFACFLRARTGSQFSCLQNQNENEPRSIPSHAWRAAASSCLPRKTSGILRHRRQSIFHQAHHWPWRDHTIR